MVIKKIEIKKNAKSNVISHLIRLLYFFVHGYFF